MMAGSQVVHTYYKPLEDLESLIAKHKERLLREYQEKSTKSVSDGTSTEKPNAS